MRDFVVRLPEQLAPILQRFRKARGLTQAQLAQQLGVSQQTLSAMERNAAHATATTLLKVLAVLQVELVLRDTRAGVERADTASVSASAENW